MRSIIVILIALSIVGILVSPSIDDDVDAICLSNAAFNGSIALNSTENAVEHETTAVSQLSSPIHSSRHEVIRC